MRLSVYAVVGLAMWCAVVGSPAIAALPADANPYCPVMPDEVTDARYFSKVGESNVYFCCKRCRDKFIATPSAYPAPPVATVADLSSDVGSAGHDGHDHGDHDHSAHSHGGVYSLIGKVHPILVHFPIALLIVSAAWLCVERVKRILPTHSPVKYLLLLGLISAVASAFSGWVNAHDYGAVGERLVIFERHRFLGFTTLALSLIACLGAWKHDSTKIWPLWLVGVSFVMALVVGATGHHGGLLIFGLEYF